ncbi:MAG: L-histidine N(alpha)-methyltransferase [Pseudomonadales bacterium]|nr:L-histidine N(alpha)-methyltransferase [Pseudomonadales bacterium]
MLDTLDSHLVAEALVEQENTELINLSSLGQAISRHANLYFWDCHSATNDDVADILSGLTQQQKTLSPKFFYDTYGSELFEKITGLPEYYPTRTERSILMREASEIADYCGAGCVMIEPGSGSSEKVKLLLNSVKPKAYVGLDIASDFLHYSAEQLAIQFPDLDVYAICADFANMPAMPNDLPSGKRVIFYPGSTIGNMQPMQALTFLCMLKMWLQGDQRDKDAQQGGLLIGVDLHKATSILEPAYDDAQGITAAFNVNALANINHIAQADFQLDKFSHRAFYNQQLQRIEMHLHSECHQVVNVAGQTIHFSKGETIHTENSYKYKLDDFAALAAQAGFVLEKSWLDAQQLFSVNYLRLA